MPGFVMASGRWVSLAELVVVNHPGHGSQKSHGRKGDHHVRDSLAEAKTSEEVSAVAAAEARRITGRDIDFDLGAENPEIAREHAEGVLQGLERFPNATLAGVRTYDESHPYYRDQPKALAVTGAHGMMEGGKLVIQSNIYFNVGKPYDNPANTRRLMQESAESGHLTSGTPTGTALHEFGHVIHNQYGSLARTAYDHAVRSAEAAGASPRAHIGRGVSAYATTNPSEFTAEIFADVMVNGDGASALSKSTFEVLERVVSK